MPTLPFSATSAGPARLQGQCALWQCRLLRHPWRSSEGDSLRRGAPKAGSIGCCATILPRGKANCISEAVKGLSKVSWEASVHWDVCVCMCKGRDLTSQQRQRLHLVVGTQVQQPPRRVHEVREVVEQPEPGPDGVDAHFLQGPVLRRNGVRQAQLQRHRHPCREREVVSPQPHPRAALALGGGKILQPEPPSPPEKSLLLGEGRVPTWGQGRQGC